MCSKWGRDRLCTHNAFSSLVSLSRNINVEVIKKLLPSLHTFPIQARFPKHRAGSSFRFSVPREVGILLIVGGEVKAGRG